MEHVKCHQCGLTYDEVFTEDKEPTKATLEKACDNCRRTIWQHRIYICNGGITHG